MRVHASNLVSALNIAIEKQSKDEAVDDKTEIRSAFLEGIIRTRDAIKNGESIEIVYTYGDTGLDHLTY